MNAYSILLGKPVRKLHFEDREGGRRIGYIFGR
jgi:hypothetical protein